MKLRKTSIAILLLAALLLSACGAGQEPATETAESRPLARSSLGEGIYYQTLAGAVGERALTGATDNLFSAKFEGDRVAGSAGPVNGNYRIQATQTDGEAWHVKLECNYHTTPGRDYRVTYRFHSDVGGLVKFGDHQEFTVVAGDQAEYDACFDGDYENAYGALYGRSLTAGGTDHVEYTVTPHVSHGPLTLRLRRVTTSSAFPASPWIRSVAIPSASARGRTSPSPAFLR